MSTVTCVIEILQFGSDFTSSNNTLLQNNKTKEHFKEIYFCFYNKKNPVISDKYKYCIEKITVCICQRILITDGNLHKHLGVECQDFIACRLFV